ncbi:hypothetical protein [Zavarzinella formosa]|uniref:hypothetical protein n=1 Tax=Zavarzinella formosa TaxID=360055 RepID=UPI0002EA587F|nr:hypothetical protein [Zavarzinella formosa]
MDQSPSPIYEDEVTVTYFTDAADIPFPADEHALLARLKNEGWVLRRFRMTPEGTGR